MDLLKIAAVLSLDSTNYNKGLSDAESTASTGGGKIGQALGTAGKVAGAALAAASTAVVAFGKQSVETGMSFDSGMSQVAATLGLVKDATGEWTKDGEAAGDTFDMLREKALEMGSATMYTAEQSAEGLNILAMSGYSAEESVGMIEDVLHLAAAGSMELSEAAGYVSGSMKGFADDTKDAEYYADLMAKGATLANTSVSQLGEAMSSGAATASAYGQEADSMTVALLRLAEQGEVGSAAGTALAAAMKNLYTPTDQAKGALIELGVASYNADGSARDFNDVVNDLQGALSGMTAEEAAAYKQTIFGIQGLDAFNKMTVTSIDKQNDWADALANSTGEASRQYTTMTDNLQGDITTFDSALDGLKIALSDSLTPTLREFVQFGSDGLSRLTSAFREGGLTGAAEEFGNILGDGLKMITDMLPKVLEAATALIETFVTAIAENLPHIVETIANVLPDIITTLIALVTSIIGQLGDIIQPIIEALPDIILAIVMGLLENLPALIKGLVNLVMGVVNAIPVIIEELIAATPTIIEMLIVSLVECLPQLIIGIGELVLGLIKAIPAILKGLWEAITSVMDTDLFKTVLANIGQFFTNAAAAIYSFFSGILSGIVGWLGKIISGIGTGLTSIWSSISSWFGSVASNIGSLLSNIWSSISGWFSNVISGVAGFVGNIGSAISSWFSGIFSSLGGWLGEIWTSLTSWFSNAVSEMGRIGLNLIQGLWNGISNAAQWLHDQISGFVSGVLGWVEGLFGIESPSKEMAFVGEMLDRGLGEGIMGSLGTVEDAASDLKESVMGELGGMSANVDVSGSASVSSGSTAIRGGVSAFGGIVLNVYGAQGQDVNELANIVMRKLQNAVDSKAAVYA